MLEQKNLSKEEVIEMGNTFPIEPMFNKVIITLNTEESDGMLVVSDNTMSEEQYIVAKGEHVHSVTQGQKVIIDLEKMMSKELNPENTHETISRIKIDPIFIDGITYAIIEDRYIKAKFRD